MSILAATCNLLLVAEVSLKICLWVVATVAMVYLITMERTNLIRFPGRFVMKIAKSLGKTVLLGQYVFLTLIITIILKTCAIEPITLYALHLSCRYASCTTLLLLFSNVRFCIDSKKDGNINESQESNNEIQVDKHENLNEDSGFQCEHISKLQSAGTIENNADDPQKTKAEENKKDTNEFQIEKSKVEIDTQSQSCNQEETLMNKTEQEEKQSIKKQSKENNFQNESFEDNSSTYTLEEEVTKESENENYDNIEYDGYLCFK